MLTIDPSKITDKKIIKKLNTMMDSPLGDKMKTITFTTRSNSQNLEPLKPKHEKKVSLDLKLPSLKKERARYSSVMSNARQDKWSEQPHHLSHANFDPTQGLIFRNIPVK
jgi:hypothetical protein